MKKFFLLGLAVVACVFAACGQAESVDKAAAAEVVLLTAVADPDQDQYDAEIWSGMKEYAANHNASCGYLSAAADTAEAWAQAVAEAVSTGAKLVVAYGDPAKEAAVYDAQYIYPDLDFVLIDGEPHSTDYAAYAREKNVCTVSFAEEQAGFLAGYAAVKEGYVKLGFMGGMAVPATVAYGAGYLQGVDCAAREMGASVEVLYHYTRSPAATPEAQTLAGSWYTNGAECIFTCGAVSESVIAAAEPSGAKMIGAGVDQSDWSATVLTTAEKGVAAAVYDALDQYYQGKFPGGATMVLDAADGGVGLEMANARFTAFSDEDYKMILLSLANGSVAVQRVTDENVDLRTLIGGAVKLSVE